jgi:3-hydroxyacyl-CoA dehydrogenase
MGAPSPAETPQAHLAQAERDVWRIDDLDPRAAARPVRRVGVIGAGTMGVGIAISFLSANLPVVLVENSAEALQRGAGAIRETYARAVARGRTSRAEADASLAKLATSLELAALGDCDLVIEAVFEDLAIKRRLFADLDRIARRGAVLASNTSYLSIDEIAAATGRPEDCVGLHFFSPANVMRLLEVVRGARTGDAVLATAMEVARRIGKTPAVARVCRGFIGNRMLAQRQGEATRLVLEGAEPEAVDKVHLAFGMPMGPFQMTDLAGLDVGWSRDPTRVETLREAFCAAGRFGQKVKAGYYDYDDGRKPHPSARAAEIIEAFRARSGLRPRKIDEAEILERTLYPLINEGAQILEEGIAQRAGDIDVVWVRGYGWPAHTGGPMFWAEREGLARIVEGLQRRRPQLAEDFALSPRLVRAAERGGRFEA